MISHIPPSKPKRKESIINGLRLTKDMYGKQNKQVFPRELVTLRSRGSAVAVAQ